MASKFSPLANVRILDFSRVLAGPFCTMLLGDLGAEVWKVERPGVGDDTRNWKPPAVNGESCYFMSINRNKKSVAIDLKHPKGQQLARQLAAKCDVVLENFKPGNLKRLGLDYDTLSAQSPQLVYCSITGYGQTGPWANKGGYDVIAEAVGGLLHITGPADGEPCKAGVAVVDMLTGLYAHGAIMAALMQRQATGQGQAIDCNLMATQIATLVNIGSNYLNAGIDGRRWGTAHESIVPYQAFKTSDQKWFVVGAGNDAAFAELCALVQLSDLALSPLYKSNADRVHNRSLLIDTLSQRFAEQPLQFWEKAFENATLPNGPVNNMEGAFNNPQVKHLDLVKSLLHPKAGPIKMTGPAVRFSQADNVIRLPPPSLGQHTKEVLGSILDFDEQQLINLKNERVIDFP
uniref:CoA transferase n=1 Tax=Plectus sambesii TaxID=2011161 RepID=A0A914W6I9_9BILA